MAKPSLKATKLVKSYEGRRVVNEVDLTVKAGEVVGLLGPNGAGKTTTFLMMVGLIRPEAGRVILDGEDVTGEPLHRRARKGLGYLPQEPSVFRKLTVEENFDAILELVESSKDKCRERREELIQQFELEDVRGSLGKSLSGGERRRVEIARALIPEPTFLLLDEPFAGVDPIAVEDVQEIVKDLRDQDLGILITDHNVRETLAITNRSYIMNEGEILVSGDAPSLVSNPQVRKVYLGRSFDYSSTSPGTGREVRMNQFEE